jgi:hypothetical protein
MYLIYYDEMSRSFSGHLWIDLCITNSSRYILLEAIHTYILRYDMHHSSMCGTVLNNAVYVWCLSRYLTTASTVCVLTW